MEWEAQRPSGASTPSSLSSQSTGNNVIGKSEKIPMLKQISPSPSVAALSKQSDDDLRRKGLEEVLRILRKTEADYKSVLSEHSNVVKEVNRRFQIFALETRGLKEVNQRLQDDNQELRDLCCFLDDDRQRARKLAREWQRFGRYTASVMRSEVAVYQEKLRELEDHQSELVTENMELKELCLFLDQERVRMTGDRDDGDGSSNGTTTGQEDLVVGMETTNGSTTPTNTMPNPPIPSSLPNGGYPITPSSTASYIRELELKIHRLEEEKKMLAQRVDRNGADGVNVSLPVDDLSSGDGPWDNSLLHAPVTGVNSYNESTLTANKPEAVVHAMKVLQVHEELEGGPRDEDLDDPEKAIVREMCNVVWRKLGDVGDVGSFNESSDSILDPPFIPDSPGQPPSSISSPGPLSSISHGQAHSYNVSHPVPQMASTPLSSQSSRPSLPLRGSDQRDFARSSFRHEVDRTERSAPSHTDTSPRPAPSNPGPNQMGYGPSEPTSRSHYHSPDNRYRSENRQSGPAYSSGVLNRPQQLPQASQQNAPSTSQQQDLRPQHHPSQQPTSSQRQPVSLIQQPHRTSDSLYHPAQSYQQQPQQRPPDHQAPPVMPRNQGQRSVSDFNPQQNRPPGPHSLPPSSSENVGFPSRSQRDSLRGKSLQQLPSNANYQSVRLLDAPGVHNYGNTDGSVVSQSQMPAKNSAESGTHFQVQARPRSRGENPYDSSGAISGRSGPANADPRVISSTSSSASHPSQGSILHPNHVNNPPSGPPPSQSNPRAPSGFKAYPPQLNSMPTQPVAYSGGRPLEREPYRTQNQNQQLQRTQPANPNQNFPQRAPPQTQNKRFQEQEWRQTFLDDSDIL